jgi:hypothetical protein
MRCNLFFDSQFENCTWSQGCQIFQTKNPNLGKFWRALDGKMFVYFRTFLYFMDIYIVYLAIG